MTSINLKLKKKKRFFIYLKSFDFFWFKYAPQAYYVCCYCADMFLIFHIFPIGVTEVYDIHIGPSAVVFSELCHFGFLRLKVKEVDCICG